jgi:hypothetical protein
MMTQDRDDEDALRRALTAAAESIEPADDGLQRIRHRLDSRRSPGSVLSRGTEWLDVHGTRFLVRLEPAIEAGRTALRRTGPLSGLLLALGRFLAGAFNPRGRRRAGGHRGAATPPGRLGPAGAWLKPVFAISAAVAIVAVGVVILNHETSTLISPTTNNVGTAGPASSLGSGGRTANSTRWKLPLGVKATQQLTGPTRNKSVASVLPAVACTPTPTPAASTPAPAGSDTPTPTPSVTGSPTSTPTAPQPTESGLPTPTPTASAATGGPADATDATAATVAAMVVPYDPGTPIVECGATSKSPKPSQTP